MRAIALVATAENDVVIACRAKQRYSLQSLKDLVRDFQIGGGMGQQLVSIIADLAWGHANLRKRYSKDTPQGQDQGLPLGNARLEQLRSGSLIFVLDGVEMTDGSGNVIGHYGEQKEAAGLTSGSTMRSDVGVPSGIWGDLPCNRYRPDSGRDWDW